MTTSQALHRVDYSLVADAVIEVTSAVCDSLLGATPVPCADPHSSDRLSAWVSISGAWTGDVEIRMSPRLAQRLAHEVLSVNASSTDDPDVHDVAGEVANMIGGNLKAILPEPCRLSLPSVICPARAAHPDLVQAFAIGGEGFEVAVTERVDPVESAAE